MAGEKVAWIVGKIPINRQMIRSRGYDIREFGQRTDSRQYVDDQPDLIIFSEAGVTDVSIFFKMKYFYPDTIILTVPDLPRKSPPQKSSQPEEGNALSISRLLNAIRKIEGE